MRYSTKRRHAGALIAFAVCTVSHAAPDPQTSTAYLTELAHIRDAAMSHDWAYERLTDLTDLIGPRLAGSPGASAAVVQVKAAMDKIGLKTSLLPAKVPHWVRGQETAELVDYVGRPDGVTQKVVLTALGGSGATPPEGLTAPVLVVHSFDELQEHSKEVKGKIVLYDVAFDQHLADAGMHGDAYGQAGRYRFGGPMAAAKLGASAVLVRSVGGANFRLTHTGATRLPADAHIAAAAVTAEDAMLMTRLAKRGEVRMHLTVTPQTLPDADSYNVIAEIPGSDKSDEVVLVSGHLDSWDLAQGANDDGAGVTAAMGALEVIKSLKLQPRRTIRFVAWMNEENGGRGADAYFNAYKNDVNKHFAAIESDSGSGRPLGLVASVSPKASKLFSPMYNSMLSIGAASILQRNRLGTGDLSELEDAGVPCFEPRVDGHDYFHYHHTPADTLDKVEPDNLRRHVALLSILTWQLANMPEAIGRAPKVDD